MDLWSVSLFLATMNKNKAGVKKFLYEHVFNSLIYLELCKIAGSYGHPLFNFLRNCQKAFMKKMKQLHHFTFPPAM